MAEKCTEKCQYVCKRVLINELTALAVSVIFSSVLLKFLIYCRDLEWGIGASATKRFVRSRIFRYGCLKIILSNRQKKSEGLSKRKPIVQGLAVVECLAVLLRNGDGNGLDLGVGLQSVLAQLAAHPGHLQVKIFQQYFFTDGRW